MVTKTVVPARGVQRPKVAVRPKHQSKADDKLDELDEELRTRFEAWRKEKERKGARGATDELLKQFLEKQTEKSKDKKEKQSGLSDDRCGAIRTRMDLELLAEKVFMRLICEARIERERSGWAG